MWDNLHSSIQQIAQRVVSTVHQPRYGTVASVDPTSHAVKVLIQPEGVLTGWLPSMSTQVGANWGLSHLHSPGDQVLVLPVEGDLGNGVVMGGIYSTQQQPPQTPATPGGQPTSGQAGEFLLKHQSGSYMRFCADGSMIANATVFNLNGPVNIYGGDLTVKDGNVVDQSGSLQRLRAMVNSHVHSGVQTGTGVSKLPTTQDAVSSAPANPFAGD